MTLTRRERYILLKDFLKELIKFTPWWTRNGRTGCTCESPCVFFRFLCFCHMEALSGELMPPLILLVESLSAGVTRMANSNLNSEIGMARRSRFARGHGICGVLWWDPFSFALLALRGYPRTWLCNGLWQDTARRFACFSSINGFHPYWIRIGCSAWHQFSRDRRRFCRRQWDDLLAS